MGLDDIYIIENRRLMLIEGSYNPKTNVEEGVYMEVLPPLRPNIRVDEALVPFVGSQTQSSDTQTYTVEASNIHTSIRILAPEWLEVSLNQTVWGRAITLYAEDGAIVPTTIYVRMIPSSLGDYEGEITHRAGLELVSFAVTGSVAASVTGVKYGFLYNWFATQDQGGGVNIIPADMAAAGWDVASDADWTALTDYIQAEITAGRLPDVGIGNILKSRRQVNSPLGAPWATNEHPRWDESATHYGRDSVGFNALPGGYRDSDGAFYTIGNNGILWSSTQSNASSAWWRYMRFSQNNVSRLANAKKRGVALRPVRPATVPEQALPDGIIAATYTGNDGKVYRCTKIGTQVWLADNLAETKWSDGTWISGYNDGTYSPISNAAWAALTTAALCAYNDDELNVLI